MKQKLLISLIYITCGCQAAYASFSSDTGLTEESFSKELALLFSTNPEVIDSQESDIYTKYIECISEKKAEVVAGNSSLKVGRCNLPPDDPRTL